MSNAILKGNASGTGSVTLESPNTNSDRTISLPDADGTAMVSGNMPAFSASATSNQSISAATFTKVNFGTEQFDTNSNFASSRFTPNVAGYYQVNTAINFGGGSTVTYGIVSFYKNGGEYNRAIAIQSTNNLSIGGSSLIYLNGSTDYLEVYAYSGQSGTQIYGDAGTAFTYFNGALVRAA